MPFDASDCAMYVRLIVAGHWQREGGGGHGGGGSAGESGGIGVILDVASVLKDVEALLGIKGVRGRVRTVATANGTEGGGGGDDEEEYAQTRERLVGLERAMGKGEIRRGEWPAEYVAGEAGGRPRGSVLPGS